MAETLTTRKRARELSTKLRSSAITMKDEFNLKRLEKRKLQLLVLLMAHDAEVEILEKLMLYYCLKVQRCKKEVIVPRSFQSNLQFMNFNNLEICFCRYSNCWRFHDLCSVTDYVYLILLIDSILHSKKVTCKHYMTASNSWQNSNEKWTAQPEFSTEFCVTQGCPTVTLFGRKFQLRNHPIEYYLITMHFVRNKDLSYKHITSETSY